MNKVKITAAVVSALLLTACARHREAESVPDATLYDDITQTDPSAPLPIATATPEPAIPAAPAAPAASDYPKVLTPATDRIEFAYQSEGIYCIWTGEQFGYWDEEDREITPFIYDYAYPFQEGLALIVKDGKYGFIDKSGSEAIPLIYDKAASFSEGLAYFEIDNTYGFMNQKGEEVFRLDCDSVSSFQEDRAYFSDGGKYGYIDSNGTRVIEPVYDDALYFNQGLAWVRKGGNSGLIDQDGHEVVPIQYDKIEIMNYNIKATRDNKETYFDLSGNQITFPEGELQSLGKDYNIIKVNQKLGVWDASGNEILAPVFDNIVYIENSNLFIVCQNEKYGIITNQEEIKVPCEYDSLSLLYDYNSDAPPAFAYIERNEQWGILSLTDFSEIVSPAYEGMVDFVNGYSIVLLNGEYGLIDKNGGSAIPFGEYDYIVFLFDSLLCLEKNDKYYLANQKGELISDQYYDEINQFARAGEYLVFEKNGKCGLLDANGNEFLAAGYDYIANTSASVYYSQTSFIVTNYDDPIRNHILVTAPAEEIDLSDVVLANEITPKMPLYHDQAQEFLLGSENNNVDLSGCLQRNRVKLYRADGYEEPVLYLYAEPPVRISFPRSNSAFYVMDNGQVSKAVTGYESGGSMRGDYAQLYYEKESGGILLGTSGFYGGFGGNASDKVIYKNNEIYLDMQWIYQGRGGYSYDDSFLLENAHLFYSDSEPLNKDNILETQTMECYTINERIVTVEEFNQESAKYASLSMQS